MKIISDIKDMSLLSRTARRQGQSVGFVPTMGALHEGHLSLIRQARRENKLVVVSIFVNPSQFSPREDLKKYPRNLRYDANLCRKEGVDVIFYPHSKDMYPPGYKTYVSVLDLSEVLCGKFRPGHFKGVTTVVAKLFNIIQPDTAYFGQKDAQQAIIIRRMIEDLNIPVKIKALPTVREKYGLALSSRNIYLSRDERKDAAILYQALKLARDLINKGKISSSYVIQKMRRLINKKKHARIQYISIVNPNDLHPVKIIKDKTLIALAVYMGKTRLIDNIIVN